MYLKLSVPLYVFTKLQVPSYQKPRVYLPSHQQQQHQGDGQDHMGNEPRIRQPSGHIYNATKFSGNLEGDFDGKRIRKTMVRKTVDYNTAVVKYLEVQFQFLTSHVSMFYTPLHMIQSLKGIFNYV